MNDLNHTDKTCLLLFCSKQATISTLRLPIKRLRIVLLFVSLLLCHMLLSADSSLQVWMGRAKDDRIELLPIQTCTPDFILDVIDLDFLDDVELVLLGRTNASGSDGDSKCDDRRESLYADMAAEPEHVLAMVGYRELDWTQAISRIEKVSVFDNNASFSMSTTLRRPSHSR